MPIRLYVAPSSMVTVPFILGMPFIRASRLTFDHLIDQERLMIRLNLGNVRLITPAAGAVKYDAPRLGRRGAEY
jgi:hypothetical protein